MLAARCRGAMGFSAAGRRYSKAFELGTQTFRPKTGFNPRAVRRLSELAELDFACRLRGILGRLTLLNLASVRLRYDCFPVGVPMFDPATTALLRAVLDEVCGDVSRYETGARTHVASRILEAATKGDTSRDRLKQVGREALHDAPTMWRQR